MSDIGPGDWVECVGRTESAEVAVGGVYRVERLVPAWGECIACGREDDDLGLLFAGHRVFRAGDYLMSWCPCRFRPIYRPKEQLLRDLLEPVPA